MAHFNHGHPLHQACVVHEDVHGAHLCLDLGDHSVDGGFVGDVSDVAVGVDARFLVGGDAFFKAALVGAVEADRRAALGHARSDGKTDAVGTAGDEGDFALQIECRKIHNFLLKLNF